MQQFGINNPTASCIMYVREKAIMAVKTSRDIIFTIIYSKHVDLSNISNVKECNITYKNFVKNY